MKYSTEYLELLRNISLVFHVFIIIFGLVLGILFLNKSRSHAHEKSKTIFLLLALFFITIGIAYIFRIVFVFIIPPNMELFYTELMVERTENTQFLSVAYAFLVYIGMIYLCASVEFSVFKKKTHYLFSITIIVSIILIGILIGLDILHYEAALIVQMIPMFISFSIIALFSGVYFYLAIKNPGQVRKKSVLIGFGLLFFIISMTIASHTFIMFVNAIEIPLIISPLLLIIGFTFLLLGYTSKI